MTRPHLFISVCVMALATVAAGCADHPASDGQPSGSSSAEPASGHAHRFGVSPKLLAAASNLGYNPRVVNGKTVFCQKEANTGSIISHYYCVNAASLRIQLLQENHSRNRLERATSRQP